VQERYSCSHLEDALKVFCENLCKDDNQSCYMATLKPFEATGMAVDQEENPGCCLGFEAYSISKLLHSWCITSVCQNSTEFCGGDEYQIAVQLHCSTSDLLEIDVNLILLLAINLYLSLVKQRVQSPT